MQSFRRKLGLIFLAFDLARIVGNVRYGRRAAVFSPKDAQWSCHPSRARRLVKLPASAAVSGLRRMSSCKKKNKNVLQAISTSRPVETNQYRAARRRYPVRSLKTDSQRVITATLRSENHDMSKNARTRPHRGTKCQRPWALRGKQPSRDAVRQKAAPGGIQQ